MRRFQRGEGIKFRWYYLLAIVFAVAIGIFITQEKVISPVPRGSGIEVIIVSPPPSVGGTEFRYGNP